LNLLTKTKKFIILILAITVAAVLTGCTQYTVAEAEQHPYAVIQLTPASLTESATFAYYDREGVQKDLPDCGQENMFTKKYCRTINGLVSFSYTKRKTNIRNASITVEGTTYNLTCTKNADDPFSRKSICIPNSN
jgi:hypothetical protein